MNVDNLLSKNLNVLHSLNPGLTLLISKLKESSLSVFDKDERKVIVEDLKNPRILIFLGVGSGNHLIEYAKSPHPLNQLIIIIEPSLGNFKRALSQTDLTPLIKSQQVHWLIGSDSREADLLFYKLFSNVSNLVLANAIEYFPSISSDQPHDPFYDDVKQIIASAIGHQFNRYFGDPFDSFLGIQNTLSNLEKMSQMPHLDQAQNQFSDVSGVIVASGPSLTQNLPHLKKIQDKCIIIACPSAIPILQKNDIIPHFWVNMERSTEQGNFFSNLPKNDDHFFVGLPLIDPKCYLSKPALNTYLKGAHLLSEWLPLPGQAIDMGHSSAHAAFRILQILGCSSIFLFGQDLSYNDNASHAEDSWEESKRLMNNLKKSDKKIFDIESNSGGLIRTNLYFYTYLKTLTEQLIPEYNKTVYNVIDSSMGAKIDGALRIDGEKIDDYFPEKKSNIFERLKISLKEPSKEVQAKINRQVLESIEATKYGLEVIKNEFMRLSLLSKEFQFKPEVISEKWDIVKYQYDIFLKEINQLSHQFTNTSNSKDVAWVYKTFFHPVVQGIFISYRIEFFSSADDLKGDFSVITKKINIIHQMSKDGHFWTEACLAILRGKK